MTDAERLLEIFGERELFLMRQTAAALAPPYTGAWQAMNAVDRWLLDGISDAGHIVADQIDKMAGERTGAREERGQDVSDELLELAREAADETAHLSQGLMDEFRWRAVERDLFRVQRARAAGKGEG